MEIQLEAPTFSSNFPSMAKTITNISSRYKHPYMVSTAFDMQGIYIYTDNKSTANEKEAASRHSQSQWYITKCAQIWIARFRYASLWKETTCSNAAASPVVLRNAAINPHPGMGSMWSTNRKIGELNQQQKLTMPPKCILRIRLRGRSYG